MIKSTTFRGSLTDENEQTDTYNITEERWIGEIVRVPHPASGHMGSSMGEVVDTKTSTANQRVEPLKDKPKDEREYEEYEYTILVVEDLISKQTYHTHQSGNPEASFAADGSTYSVYGIEQQKEDGEWNQIPFPNGAKWGHNQFAVESVRKNINPKNTIVIERSVTFHRDDDADATDPTAYTLTKETKPIDVKPP